MGYSHYYEFAPAKIDDTSWAAFTTACADIFDAAETRGIPLGDAFGEDEPEIGRHVVAFNGAMPDDYESCVIDRRVPEPPTDPNDHAVRWAHEQYIERGERKWLFAKTDRRPYDQVVCAVLLAAHETLPDFDPWSDGDWSDWVDGRTLFRQALGHTPGVPPKMR